VNPSGRRIKPVPGSGVASLYTEDATASRERALDVIFQQQNRIQERLVHCLNADDILKLLLREEGQKTPL
jgi:hypothetical protein